MIKAMNNIRYNLIKIIPDKIYLQMQYYKYFHSFIDYRNPQTFNEKLQWLKIYDRKPQYSIMVDKYEAKKYVADILGSEYIIPTIGVWDDPAKIDFDSLPDQFVLKWNNDSKSTIICEKKSDFDRQAAVNSLSKRYGQNGYWYSREWPYKNITPRIIAEQYLNDDSLEGLKDYKFFCFNGHVKCFKIDYDRATNHGANYYDAEGNLLPFGEVVCPPQKNKKINMPSRLVEMIAIAERLSKGISFLRVDLYEVQKKIYFGEMTFYPAAGVGPFTSQEWDKILGDWICLPNI